MSPPPAKKTAVRVGARPPAGMTPTAAETPAGIGVGTPAEIQATVGTRVEAPVGAPVEAPAPGAGTEPWAEEARTAIAAMVGARDKHAVPTLVTWRTGRLDRHVIVDVPEERLRRAWEWWSANVNGDAERFLGVVYAVLQCDVPRMYRAVGNLRLGER